MEGSACLIVLALGQLTLLALDLRERLARDRSADGAPGLRSAVFLAATILVYGSLQYGGLALVPGAEQLVAASREFVEDLVPAGPGVPGRAAWAIVAIGVAAFYFAGLCDYLLHRFVSHSRALWFTHENHHLPTDVSVYMPGLFVRPFAFLATFPTMAIAICSLQLGLSLAGLGRTDIMPLLYAAVSAQLGIGSMSHSAYLRRCEWIHGILKPLGLTTPQEHWLHHVAGCDGNYGNFTTLWDRVFGTYLDPKRMHGGAHRAGLEYDQDFLGTLTFGKLKLPERVRRDFQLDKFCYLEPRGS